MYNKTSQSAAQTAPLVGEPRGLHSEPEASSGGSCELASPIRGGGSTAGADGEVKPEAEPLSHAPRASSPNRGALGRSVLAEQNEESPFGRELAGSAETGRGIGL